MLRVGKSGKPFTLFETKDLSVQVVRDWAGRRALCGNHAERQGLQAESGRDGEAGRRDSHASSSIWQGSGQQAGGADAEKTADDESRRQARREIALHLGHDVRHRGAAVHRHRRTRAQSIAWI